MTLAHLLIACGIWNFSICRNEKYSFDGFSHNLFITIKAGLYLMKQTGMELASLNGSIQIFFMILSSAVIFPLAALEMMIHHFIWFVIVVGLIIATHKTSSIDKKG
jgi:hypothetical protein